MHVSGTGVVRDYHVSSAITMDLQEFMHGVDFEDDDVPLQLAENEAALGAVNCGVVAAATLQMIEQPILSIDNVVAHLVWHKDSMNRLFPLYIASMTLSSFVVEALLRHMIRYVERGGPSLISADILHFQSNLSVPQERFVACTANTYKPFHRNAEQV